MSFLNSLNNVSSLFTFVLSAIPPVKNLKVRSRTSCFELHIVPKHEAFFYFTAEHFNYSGCFTIETCYFKINKR